MHINTYAILASKHTRHWLHIPYTNLQLIIATVKCTIPIQRLLGIHRINDDFCLAKGDQWFSITEQFVHYIVSRAQMIQQQYSCTYCADELFIQSALIQSPFIKHHTNDCLRLIDWDRGAPYTFKSNDFDELMHSKKLIARKFDESTDPIIIDKIYRKLQHKQ